VPTLASATNTGTTLDSASASTATNCDVTASACHANEHNVASCIPSESGFKCLRKQLLGKKIGVETE
jgi:hypothetical protein